jgi:hypothetical protein
MVSARVMVIYIYIYIYIDSPSANSGLRYFSIQIESGEISVYPMNKTQMSTPADIFYGSTNSKGDLSRFWIFCLGTLVFLAHTDFKLIVFQT